MNAELRHRLLQQWHRQGEFWLQQPEAQLNLSIPDEVVSSLFIPDRLLDFATDPTKLSTLIYETNGQKLSFLVYEEMLQPISDEKTLREYWMNPPAPIPANMDYFQATDALGLFQFNKIGLNKRVFLQVGVGKAQTEGILRVRYYDDRPELRHQGIGTDFNRKLREFAQKTGFWAITGGQNYTNVSFYTQKVGRYPLKNIKPEYRHHFDPGWDDPSNASTLDCTTVDILDEQKRQEYLIEV